MGDELYRALGERIATLRAQKRVTQEVLGSRARMNRATVASIEAGRQRVTLDQLYQLASALELDSLSQLISLDVPRYDRFAERLPQNVSPGQAAQIDTILRSALAGVRDSRKPE
jgi:transcriptional regulator with XRE-family HTH domain